jgi:hypothetical protein
MRGMPFGVRVAGSSPGELLEEFQLRRAVEQRRHVYAEFAEVLAVRGEGVVIDVLFVEYEEAGSFFDRHME